MRLLLILVDEVKPINFPFISGKYYFQIKQINQILKIRWSMYEVIGGFVCCQQTKDAIDHHYFDLHQKANVI